MYSGDYASNLKTSIEIVSLRRQVMKIEADMRRDDVNAASKRLRKVLHATSSNITGTLVWRMLETTRAEIKREEIFEKSEYRNELRRELLLVCTGFLALCDDDDDSHQETTKERHEMLSDLIVWSFQRLEDPSLNSNMSLKGAIADFILALTMHTDTSEVIFDLMCDQNAWRRIMALCIDSFEDKGTSVIKDFSKFTEINLNRTERENTLVSLMCVAGRACQDLTHGSIARLVFGKSATGMLLAFLKQSDVEQRRDVWSIRGVLQYTRDRRVKNARRNSDKDADDLAVCVLRFGTTRRWSGFCECHEDEDGI